MRGGEEAGGKRKQDKGGCSLFSQAIVCTSEFMETPALGLEVSCSPPETCLPRVAEIRPTRRFYHEIGMEHPNVCAGLCSRRIAPFGILDIPHASVMPSGAPCTSGARGGPRFPSVHQRGPVRGWATRAAWHRRQTLDPEPKDTPCLHCPRARRSPSASPRPAA